MKIFDQDHIEYFNNYWNEHLNTSRKREFNKFHRLFNCIEIVPKSSDSLWTEYLKYLEEVSRLKIRNYYMLEYKKGSYAELHQDNGALLTAVTMLHKSDDLDGGEILYRKANRITIKKLNVGETIFYSKKDGDHGVSEVLKGIRRVLIVWMIK